MGQIKCICAITFYKLIKIWSSKYHGVSDSWNSWLRPKRPNSGVAGPKTAKEPTSWKCDSKILRFMVNGLRWVALLHFILFKTMERLHWDTAPMGMGSRTGGKPGKPQKLPKNLNADVESLCILLGIFDGRRTNHTLPLPMSHIETHVIQWPREDFVTLGVAPRLIPPYAIVKILLKCV